MLPKQRVASSSLVSRSNEHLWHEHDEGRHGPLTSKDAQASDDDLPRGFTKVGHWLRIGQLVADGTGTHNETTILRSQPGYQTRRLGAAGRQGMRHRHMA